jgi:hypothetical protein
LLGSDLSTSTCVTATAEGLLMRYDALATARLVVLRSLSLPVVSSHRQGLPWGSVDAPTTIRAIAGQGGTSGATPLLLHHCWRTNG